MKSINKFVRARKAVKADRATERGIAGHQAAMKAVGNAAGWKRLQQTPIKIGSKMYNTTPLAVPIDGGLAFEPGAGHVNSPVEKYE